MTSVVPLAMALTGALALLSATALAQTYATVRPTLSPDRAGARAALTLDIDFFGGVLGVPAAVRSSVLKFPSGLSLEVPTLRSCSAARLRADGPSGCPAQSRLGEGQALVEARAGTEDMGEQASLWAFLGPPDNLNPTIEIAAQAYTPLDERVVFAGKVQPAGPPYGEEMALSIPPIPTLVFEPDASVVSFSLTIGARAGRGSRTASSVVVPSGCPRGGLPFAAEFDYADGSTSTAQARIPCPS